MSWSQPRPPRRSRRWAAAPFAALVALIALAPGTAAAEDDAITITPSRAELHVGETVRFEGTSEAFPLVDPTWETDGSHGTIEVDPDDPTACTFTATAPGMGWVILWEGERRSGSKGSADILVLPAGDQQLSSIAVSPPEVNLDFGEQEQFSAVGYDTDGNPMDPPITPTWTTDHGTITADGTYTAPDSPGTATVTATAEGGDAAGSAEVTIPAGTGGISPWVWALLVLVAIVAAAAGWAIRR
ncbi:MAG: hypothetical protein KQH83_03470 [Actinobacteria bacterium]|nr:hypothetical protein [Actinomycetota bacterium]